MQELASDQPALGIRTESGTRRFTELLKTRERIFEEPPHVGIVVGTFAAVPYIHLQLEARRRFYPETPMLIHDDASPRQPQLEALCKQYGAYFETNTGRMVEGKGDLSAFVGGFHWAAERGIDLLVKLSRRFLPLYNWVPELTSLAFTSQYATYCSWTTTFDFGFRSECVGMVVKEWFEHGLVDAIIRELEGKRRPFVEGFIHDLSRRAAFRNCEAARAFDELVGARPRERSGYAVWEFMGFDRAVRTIRFLWHDSAEADEYARIAMLWGLPYDGRDFLDPNEGARESPTDGEVAILSLSKKR